MAEVTVKQLAQVVGTPIDKLLEQLSDAGIAKTGEGDEEDGDQADEDRGSAPGHEVVETVAEFF